VARAQALARLVQQRRRWRGRGMAPETALRPGGAPALRLLLVYRSGTC
jgi:hypothetical protein